MYNFVPELASAGLRAMEYGPTGKVCSLVGHLIGDAEAYME